MAVAATATVEQSAQVAGLPRDESFGLRVQHSRYLIYRRHGVERSMRYRKSPHPALGLIEEPTAAPGLSSPSDHPLRGVLRLERKLASAIPIKS